MVAADDVVAVAHGIAPASPRDSIETGHDKVEPGGVSFGHHPFSGPISVPRRCPIADTDIMVHPLALGASTFGWTVSESTAFSVLDRHLIHGGNLLDTADKYASGRSELIIGAWLASRGWRDQMVLCTKVGQHPENRGLRRKQIIAAVDASLTRLRTDRIDLLYFHGDDPRVPLDESLSAAAELLAVGKIRALGAADFSPERLTEARILAAIGLPKFSAITTRYNLLERDEFESSQEFVVRAQGLAVMPYFALASGYLAGSIRHRSDIRHDTRGERAGRYRGRRGARVLAVLDRIAANRGTSAACIALAWLLAKPAVVAPVASATAPEQVDCLLAAASVPLTRAEMIELDRASRLPTHGHQDSSNS